MLKEGKYCEILDEYGDKIVSLKVYGDKSHNLKIIARDVRTNEIRGTEFHSGGEVENLYEFLKVHFEGEDIEGRKGVNETEKR